MTLRECYAAIGGSCDEVIARLGSERIVSKFILKYLNDPSFDLLCRSVESENWSEAFRAAHTIKGICMNLGLGRLEKSSNLLTESLRYGYTPAAPDLFRQVEKDYRDVILAIRAFQETSASPSPREASGSKARESFYWNR